MDEKLVGVKVADVRKYFENLSTECGNIRNVEQIDNSKSRITEKSKSSELPLANVQFSEGIYFDPVTLKPISNVKFRQSKRETDRLIVIPSTIRCSTFIRELTKKNVRTGVQTILKNVETKNENEINLRFHPLKENPKFFQLSHDYEELYVKHRSTIIRRSSISSSTIYEEIRESYFNSGIKNSGYWQAAKFGPFPKIKSDQFQPHLETNKRLPCRIDNDRKLLPMRKSSEHDEEDSDDTDNADTVKRISRAKSIRQQNVFHYELQEACFINRKCPHLFELAVLIELSPNDKTNPKYYHKFMSSYRFIYPESLPDRYDSTLEMLLCLCYPNVNTMNCPKPENIIEMRDEKFVITLTDVCCDRKFAYYHRFVILRDGF